MDHELLYKFFDGQASYDEEVTIRKWLEESSENKKIFFQERVIYDHMLFLDSEPKIINKTHKNKPRLITFGLELLKTASIIIFTIWISSLYYSKHLQQEDFMSMQTIHVPSGQRVNITLADGTNVWLNARTTITYPGVFNQSTRKVTIDGEAYFEVAKDEKRPFIVETDKCRMEVLGTKFNVESYSDEDFFEAALMEGSIKVASKLGINDSLILKPETKATFKGNGKLEVTQVDDYNAYRWKEGLICFKSEPFDAIIDKLKKYYGVYIKVENKKTVNNRFTGKFRLIDGVDYALRVLQKDINFKYQWDSENNIIYIR